MSNKIVIIAAGGSGSRLQSNLPKQYLPLNGIPVLMHTIRAFVGIADRIIVVLNEQMLDTWQSLCQEHAFTLPHELVFGGDTRFQSVRNAIRYLHSTSPFAMDESTAIAIHDAARPLVDQRLIEESFRLALAGISNVLAVQSTNSIRLGNTSQSHAVDRDTVWQIQTPQSFPAPLLIEAYAKDEKPTFTDDAAVVEQQGHAIKLLESTDKNLKITYAADFQIAQFYLTDNL